MDIKVRNGSAQDHESVFYLTQNFATSFTPEKQAFEVSFKNILGDEAAHLTVAVDGDSVIGYCLGFDHYAFYANGRVSWVEEIMVIGDYRRKGVGRMMMDEFAEWSASRESKLVGLATRRAAPFYEALGYEKSAVFYRKLL